MSQKRAPESGPENAARTSFCSSHNVNPPAGRKQLCGLKSFLSAGSQLNCSCCEAVAGLRNGTTPCGDTPKRGSPRLVVGPPEKKPRKYMTCMSCTRMARSESPGAASAVTFDFSSSAFQLPP